MLDVMRSIILFLMLCLSAVAADSRSNKTSLEEFSKQVRKSYEKKDGEWMVKQTETNGVPAEIIQGLSAFLKGWWGTGNLEVTNVETFRFGDYEAQSAPGQFQGRKLRFVGNPTHWIVLQAGSPKPKPGEQNAPKMEAKLECAVFQKDGHWRIAGATYAD